MQSDVPPLPISFLTKNLHLNRLNDKKKYKNNEKFGKNNLPYEDNNKFAGKTTTTTTLLALKKKLNPIIVESSSPYKNVIRFNQSDVNINSSCSCCKNGIDQRVSSAKMLRIKELQNQLADAHHHLNELSNSNKLLEAIRKRQDAALKRYEGTKAELPRIINTHQEDYRILQTKFKKLKTQYKETSDVLKDKENELHTLQTQNKKLLQLSKDRQLLEREKLQIQVNDLNHRIEQQDDVIQTLKRKLSLESKYMKHQLHVEMVKHKETQKKLHETTLKLKSLEELFEQREKKFYTASQIGISLRDKSLKLTSQSLMNLNDASGIRSELRQQQPRRRRYQRTKIGEQSLPLIKGLKFALDVNERRSQSQENHRRDSTSYEPIIINNNNFRLPTSSPLSINSSSSVENNKAKDCVKNQEIKLKNESRSDVEIAKRTTYELPKVLKEEFGYLSEIDESSLNNDNNFTSKSRSLHTRLISSFIEDTTTNDKNSSLITDLKIQRSDSKENTDLIETDFETKYDRDSVVTVIYKELINQNDDHDDDVESEIEIPIFNDRDDNEDSSLRKSDIDDLQVNKQFFSSSSSPNRKILFEKSTNDLSIIKSTDLSVIDKKMTLESKKEEKIGNVKSTNKVVEMKKKSDSYFYDFNEDTIIDDVKVTDAVDQNKIEVEKSKGFDKAKLLAAIKAIDDNENVVTIVEQKNQKFNNNRLQITENLYKGLPSHARKRSEIVKDIFSDFNLKNSTC